jgi:site-specific recombinase XerD
LAGVLDVLIYCRPVRGFQGGSVFVQRVVLPDSRLESWTVLGDDDRPVDPVERYLAYLSDIERSPNTVKAYAHDLKDWFVFLADRGLDWREVRLDDVGAFVGWLRLPPAIRSGRVVLLPSVEHHCAEATVNRKLSAVSAFYQHAARNGVDLGGLLTSWQPAGRGGTAWRPFLHHISKGQAQSRREIRLKAPRKQPRILAPAEVQAILDACDRLRDRLLFAVLYDTGMRIGEALGLRHEDWTAAQREVAVVPRHNDNGARSKSATTRSIPVSAELIRLYADYVHGEYGDLDSDYVFVNLWSEPCGHPLSYPAVYDLVRRLRRRTGVDFDPHWYRHSFATRLLRAGTPVEVVSKLLGHASVTTTLNVYGHLSVEDARRALEKAAWFTDTAVRL